jgi:hypothetical protein
MWILQKNQVQQFPKKMTYLPFDTVTLNGDLNKNHYILFHELKNNELKNNELKNNDWIARTHDDEKVIINQYDFIYVKVKEPVRFGIWDDGINVLKLQCMYRQILEYGWLQNTTVDIRTATIAEWDLIKQTISINGGEKKRLVIFTSNKTLLNPCKI